MIPGFDSAQLTQTDGSMASMTENNVDYAFSKKLRGKNSDFKN